MDGVFDFLRLFILLYILNMAVQTKIFFENSVYIMFKGGYLRIEDWYDTCAGCRHPKDYFLTDRKNLVTF